MTNIEIEIKMFQNKNPQASIEYCDLAATLYELLWRQDAFESGVQIKNFLASFCFSFPKGRIVISDAAPSYGMTSVPCYVAIKGDGSMGIIFFTIRQLCSWLQNNWDYLIDGGKK